MALWSTRMYHHTNFGYKMSSGSDFTVQIFIDIFNLHCCLDLECSNLFLFFKLQLMMIYHQTKSGCKWINSSEDIVEIVIFWWHETLLWPWPCRYRNHLIAWHFSTWWCITIPSLVTKRSALWKISSRQTFDDILNLRCDLDLENSNQIFSHNTPAYDDAPSN